VDQLTESNQEVAALFVDDLPDAQIARKVEQAAFQAGLCLGGIGGMMVGAIIAVAASAIWRAVLRDAAPRGASVERPQILSSRAAAHLAANGVSRLR
jgi:hypothetical protein